MVSFFGEGAVNSGSFHEAVNFRRSLGPARGVCCENNLIRHGDGI